MITGETGTAESRKTRTVTARHGRGDRDATRHASPSRNGSQPPPGQETRTNAKHGRKKRQTSGSMQRRRPLLDEASRVPAGSRWRRKTRDDDDRDGRKRIWADGDGGGDSGADDARAGWWTSSGGGRHARACGGCGGRRVRLLGGWFARRGGGCSRQGAEAETGKTKEKKEKQRPGRRPLKTEDRREGGRERIGGGVPRTLSLSLSRRRRAAARPRGQCAEEETPA